MPIKEVTLKVCSEISQDIGMVIFATMFIGQIMDNPKDTVTIFMGLLFSTGFWFISLTLATKSYKIQT